MISQRRAAADRLDTQNRQCTQTRTAPLLTATACSPGRVAGLLTWRVHCEHASQKISPQRRQWCLRRYHAKSWSHHTQRDR